MPHIPVLLQEVIALTDPRLGEFVIDGTVGSGGHARAFAEIIGPKGKFLGVDWDEDSVTIASKELQPLKKEKNIWPAVFIEQANYTEIPEILRKKKIGKADILLLDLGFSSMQIDDPKRGFSFRAEEWAPLDMRYERKGPTAADEINGLPESELADIIFRYGEERNARRIAHGIVAARRRKKFSTVQELVRAIHDSFPPSRQHGKIHFATRTFQALRIHVNHEFENIQKAMDDLQEVLGSGGRAAVITFHSAEDRIVKRAFRSLAEQKVATLVTKKPVVPTREEVRRNPRARSAKLRVIRLL